MNLKRLGVMQGRLSPPEDGRFQSFLREGWREEFARARGLGIGYIEWIFDAYGAGPDATGRPANPVLTEEGAAEMLALQEKSGVRVRSMVGDWFRDAPLIRCTQAERVEREGELLRLIPRAKAVGVERIVLPFVDEARIVTEDEKRSLVETLGNALEVADAEGVGLHLECDLGPEEMAEFVGRMPHRRLKVNWDMGNSAGWGYVAREEFAAYGERIGSIHIKDRYRKPEGGFETRALGLGSVDFEDVFAAIGRQGYAGDFTMEIARGEVGDEVNHVRRQMEFLSRYWQGLVEEI